MCCKIIKENLFLSLQQSSIPSQETRIIDKKFVVATVRTRLTYNQVRDTILRCGYQAAHKTALALPPICSALTVEFIRTDSTGNDRKNGHLRACLDGHHVVRRIVHLRKSGIGMQRENSSSYGGLGIQRVSLSWRFVIASSRRRMILILKLSQSYLYNWLSLFVFARLRDTRVEEK